MDFKVRYQISADNRQAKQAFKELDDVTQRRGRSSGGLGGVADVFGGNVASQAVSRLTQELVAGSKAVFDYTQNVQGAKIAFETLMGSTAGAAQHIKELEALSRSSPLKFESIAGMSQRLQGAGVEAGKVIDLIKDIGNIAAATGPLTEERMEGIGLALSQIAAKGKLSSEELNQLSDRSIPGLRILSQQLGITTGEVLKLAEKGKISSKVVLDAFQAFSKQNYGDAMVKQAKTFGGAWQIIESTILQTSARMFKPATDALAKFTSDTAQSLIEQERMFGQHGVSMGYALGEGIGRGLREWRQSPDGGDLGLLFENPRMWFAKWASGVLAGGVSGYTTDRLIDPAFQDQVFVRRASGSTPPITGSPFGDPSTGGSNRSGDRIQSALDQYARLQEKLEARRVWEARQSYQMQTEYHEAELRKRYAVAEEYAERERRNEDKMAEFRDRLALDALEFRKGKLEDFIAALKSGTDELTAAMHDLSVLEFDIATQRAKNAKAEQDRAKERTEAAKKEHKERRDSWKKMLDDMSELQDKFDAEQERSALERLAISRQMYEGGMATAPGTLYGGIMGGLGVSLVPMFDEATNAMLSFQERMNLVKADINDFVGSAIGGMVDGLAQMAAAWLSTGEFSAKAALQMLSSVAFSIAAQAAIKAVFEAAEAVAAAARWDFVAASLHSTAATMYSSVAVIAGAAGVGLALGARAVAGDSFKSDRGGSSSGSGSSRSSEAPQPLTRATSDAYYSGTPWQRGEQYVRDSFEMVARAVGKLEKKIDVQSAGVIVTRGLQQRRGLVSETLAKEIGSNSGYGTRIGRAMGQR